MRAAPVKRTKSRTTADLYRALGLRDDRSARALAEEQLTAVLDSHPNLAPDSWCDSPALIDAAIRERARPDVMLRPRLVQAFAWARMFLVIGCHRVRRGDWNSTPTVRMAFLAERAAEAVTGRTLPIEQGVITAAALSLEIEVTRGDKGVCAWLAAYATWGAGR